MRKRIRVGLIILAVVLVVVVVAGVIAGNLLYDLALNPKADRSMVMQADHNSMESPVDPEAGQRWNAYSEWFDQQQAQDVYLLSRDALQLHAYEIRQEEPSDLWAILCHGYTGSGRQMTDSAFHFARQGYNVLMPDARGHGLSEGDYIGMGWHDRLDIVDWISRIVAEDADAQIVLYGVSMGGATVMMVSGEALPANVKAIVEDCGYSSVWDEFAYQMKELFGLPSFPVLHFASLVTRVRADYGFQEASAVNQVAKSVTPMLFIHGDQDTFVPYAMLQKVYDACQSPKEMLVAEGAGHGGASYALGDAYWETVAAFTKQYVQR